jgi:hypothetical protein
MHVQYRQPPFRVTLLFNERSRLLVATIYSRKGILLGPYSRAMPRALWWPGGAAVSCERGTPVWVVSATSHLK